MDDYNDGKDHDNDKDHNHDDKYDDRDDREKSRCQSSTFWHIPKKLGFHFLMREFKNSIE